MNPYSKVCILNWLEIFQLTLKAGRQCVLALINSRTRSSILRSLKRKINAPIFLFPLPLGDIGWILTWLSLQDAFPEYLRTGWHGLQSELSASLTMQQAQQRCTLSTHKWTSWPRKWQCQQWQQHLWEWRTVIKTGMEAGSKLSSGPHRMLWATLLG